MMHSLNLSALADRLSAEFGAETVHTNYGEGPVLDIGPWDADGLPTVQVASDGTYGTVYEIIGETSDPAEVLEFIRSAWAAADPLCPACGGECDCKITTGVTADEDGDWSEGTWGCRSCGHRFAHAQLILGEDEEAAQDADQ